MTPSSSIQIINRLVPSQNVLARPPHLNQQIQNIPLPQTNVPPPIVHSGPGFSNVPVSQQNPQHNTPISFPYQHNMPPLSVSGPNSLQNVGGLPSNSNNIGQNVSGTNIGGQNINASDIGGQNNSASNIVHQNFSGSNISGHAGGLNVCSQSVNVLNISGSVAPPSMASSVTTPITNVHVSTTSGPSGISNILPGLAVPNLSGQAGFPNTLIQSPANLPSASTTGSQYQDKMKAQEDIYPVQLTIFFICMHVLG